MIERAYRVGEAVGLAVWTQDEAGPYQTKPYPGYSWQPEGEPARQAHEYFREGTAKLMTLFHPATGEVRVKGVLSTANAILHPWLQQELTDILAGLPEPPTLSPTVTQQVWAEWQEGLSHPVRLPDPVPRLRMLLIWDNLRGHYTMDMVDWLVGRGILPLYTPLGGSWLNMAESMQRILVQRGLAGQHPQSPGRIISLLEGVAQGWNRQPTPFVWGGKRAARRQRSRARRHALGGSGACTRKRLRRRPTLVDKWRSASQTTH